MGLDGAGVLEAVEVVVQTDLRGCAGDVFEHAADLVLGHALELRQEVDLAALEVDRGVGSQLEAVELDLDVGIRVECLEAGDAGFQLALADVTPWAGDVGPHINLDHLAQPEHPSEELVAQSTIREFRPGRVLPLMLLMLG